MILAGLAFGYAINQDSAFAFHLSPELASRHMYGLNPFPESVKLAEYIRSHSETGDTIGIFGSEPQIPFYSGRRSATGYLYTYPLMETQKYAHPMKMIREIEDARPKFIVYVLVPTSWLERPSSDATIFRWADRYLMDCYRPVGMAELFPNGPTQYYWQEEAGARAFGSPNFTVVLLQRTHQ